MTDSERKIVTLDDLERRHIANHGKPYFDWIRQVVTLSTGALTALIALQGHYLPANPKIPWALAVCWLGLGSSIALGLVALRAEYGVPLAAAHQLRTMRKTHGDIAVSNFLSGNPSHNPPWYHGWSVRLMLFSFSISLLCLCVFAIYNLPPARA